MSLYAVLSSLYSVLIPLIIFGASFFYIRCFFNWSALDNTRRRALSTSACFRNPVMSRASGLRVLKDLRQLIGFVGEQFLLISYLLDSDYHI